MNPITSSTGTGAQAYSKDCAGLVERQHELLVQRILALTVTRFEPLLLQTHIAEKACKTHHSNTDELKAALNPA